MNVFLTMLGVEPRAEDMRTSIPPLRCVSSFICSSRLQVTSHVLRGSLAVLFYLVNNNTKVAICSA